MWNPMGNAYHTVPTPSLIEMWERQRDSMLGRSSSELSADDCEALYEMRRELDKRRDIPKPTVDVNFSSDYLTD